MKRFFNVDAVKYSGSEGHSLFCVCSLENPKDNAVSFITESHITSWHSFEKCNLCLIFWPKACEIPNELKNHNHVFVKCEDPHLRYCQFFEENNIKYLPECEEVDFKKGYWVSDKASIGINTSIMPGAYIGGEVVVGDNCYIGSGVKLIGTVIIGNNVVIRENTVIGADGLTTDRDETGKPVHMPQFGGVRIGDDVMIGANTVIARGAIDDTVIDEWASIDNCTFISHNVYVGKRSFVVGETIMFGSSKLGDDSFVSGNSTIRNGITIGNNTLVGMGSVVVKDVKDGMTVKGNPAR